MKLRITTFNLENLFNRYVALDRPWDGRNYEEFVLATGVVSLASRAGDLISYATTEIQRNNTAMAILDSEPDVLAVQEVENIYTLRNFNDEYLSNYFGHIISFDGNDPRGIDVGFLVKRHITGKDLESVRVTNVRTHIDDSDNKSGIVSRRYIGSLGGRQAYTVVGGIFSRDCLEVDLELKFKTRTESLTFMVNHLKAQDGAASDKRREKQSQRVAELVDEAIKANKRPIVMGDLNADAHLKNGNSVHPLTKHAQLQDPFMEVLPEKAWTHFYRGGNEVSRLDYVLPHISMKVHETDILRRGLSTKCKQYKGERYPTIGPVHTEASDHCPLTVVVEV